MRRWTCQAIVFMILAVSLFPSCSGTPAEQASKYSRRGEEYLKKEKYKEAVIEFRNAVKAVPKDGALRWKLAQAAMEAKDHRTAFQELQRVVDLEPENIDAQAKLGEYFLAAGRTQDAARIADNLVAARPGAPEGYVLKAGVAVRGGKIDEGISFLKKAVQINPKKYLPMITIGNLYLLKRDRKNALAWYDRALEANPNAPECHLVRGDYLFVAGDSEGGEKEYRRAIELSKEKEALRIVLAERYFSLGRMEDSEKELNALVREMNSQKARKILAEIKIETGKLAEAKPIVAAILKENEKDLDGKYLKGRIALAENRTGDAKTLFADVVKQDAGMAKARLYNGMTEILLGNIEVGKKEVEEAVRLDPGSARSHIVLGELLLKTNDPAKAEKEAVEALKRDPASHRAAVLYGDSFLARKDFKKAEQAYTAIVKQLPRSPVGYFKMGLVRKFQNKPAEAASYFSQAIERNPKDLSSINEYVFALAAARQPEKAKKVLDDLLAKEPGNPRIWDTKGRLHMALLQADEAEKAYLKVIELAPDFPQPYHELGVLYTSQRKLPEAEAKFREAVAKGNRTVGTYTLLGIVLGAQGKSAESVKEYRKALDLAPRNALAANNLAATLSEGGGNLDEALKFAQIARESSPEDSNIADTLGWIYYKKGLYDAASPLIGEAAKKLDRNAIVQFHLGMVLAKKGKKKEAASRLQAALALDGKFPGADEARKTLASLK